MTRPLFLAALATLIANDVVLKARFPGVVTGKLSDFAGLFDFVVFWAAFAPRWRWHIGAATAIAFVWWKSPLSQPVVDALHLHRTVDVTDLVALVVIPFACVYAQRVRWRPASVLVAALSVAAFVNTSVGESRCCAHDYVLPYAAVEDAADALRLHNVYSEYDWKRGGPYRAVLLSAKVCDSHPEARFELVADGRGGTIMRVAWISYRCLFSHDAEVQAAFEREVIAPLRGRRITSTLPAPSSPSPASASPSGAPPVRPHDQAESR